MSVANKDVIRVCAASIEKVISYGSASVPLSVSVQFVVMPSPINLTSFALLMDTSVPSSSSIMKLLIEPEPDIAPSTYVFIDCCVASFVSESDVKLSSSNIPVTVDPPALPTNPPNVMLSSAVIAPVCKLA